MDPYADRPPTAAHDSPVGISMSGGVKRSMAAKQHDRIRTSALADVQALPHRATPDPDAKRPGTSSPDLHSAMVTSDNRGPGRRQAVAARPDDSRT